MKVKTPLKATKGLNRRSKKTAKVYREERVPLVERLLKERPKCEMCRHLKSVDIHEVITRGRSGGVHGTLWLHEPNLLALCRPCHDIVTTNPDWAEENGFMASEGPDVDAILADCRDRRQLWWDSDGPLPI